MSLLSHPATKKTEKIKYQHANVQGCMLEVCEINCGNMFTRSANLAKSGLQDIDNQDKSK